MLNVGNIWTFLSSPRNWFHLQAIRVLWFSKLTQVNEELYVNLKFLWSRGKNSTCWIFEDCRHIGLRNLKPPLCAGTPGERPHGNVTGMVQCCLHCFLCSAWKCFHLLCWSTLTSDRVSQPFILGIASQAPRKGMAAVIAGICKGKAEGTLFWGDISDRTPMWRELYRWK